MIETRPNNPLTASARAWLKGRGLDPILAEEQGLQSLQRGGSEWIKIPYEVNGKVVNHKYRNIAEKKFHMDPGAPLMFWRHDVIGHCEGPLIITEGEWDALAAVQCGYHHVVSVPNGAPQTATEGHGDRYKFVEAALGKMRPLREIIIAADDDGPGAALLNDLTTLLGKARCKFVRYPTGAKDLNDVLRLFGRGEVKRCIEDARWVHVAGVYSIEEMPPLVPLTVWRPEVYPSVDKKLAVCPGHVSIWTGIPGHGKSALINSVMWTIAERYNLRVAVGSFEATPQREYLQALVSYRTRKHIDDATQEDYYAARAWLSEHVKFLSADGYVVGGEDEDTESTLEWFVNAATTAIVRYGCKIVVLDPWSQIDHERDWKTSEHEYVGFALRTFKRLARRFDVHVAIVAHPRKIIQNKNGTYAIPGGYEVSGSAHWFNFPDLGVTVHRDPEIDMATGEPIPTSTRTRVRVWKIKNHASMGQPGDVLLNYVPRDGRYESASSWS